MATVYKHVYVSFLIAVSFLCFFIIRKYSIYLISCICIPVLFKVVKKLLNSMIPLKGKAILITGCDTGQFEFCLSLKG